MSVLNRQAVPESFLHETEGFDREFEEALVVLLGFPLLTVDASQKHFSMHRMVQLASKKWLESRNEMRLASEWCLRRMSEQFLLGTYENRAKCAELVPHVEPILNVVECDNKELRLLICTVYFNCAWYYSTLGKYEVAETMNRRALEGREKELGPTF